MEIRTNDYTVTYDPDSATVVIRGFLRLEGVDGYQPVMDLLLTAAETAETCIVDLQELEFLNSSGISMLSMFVVKIRQRGNIHLTFRGSDQILWQTKSLKNLQRLMPSLNLEFA